MIRIQFKMYSTHEIQQLEQNFKTFVKNILKALFYRIHFIPAKKKKNVNLIVWNC